jgi:hypothetical protein
MRAACSLLLVLAGGIGLPHMALARAGMPALPNLCDAAIVQAEREARLPPLLLAAIAVVETGRVDALSARLHPWPWTIDAEGAGQFFASKPQAIAAVRALQARGIRSIDVGCLQVNLLFHPNAFPNLEAAFDPLVNARYASRFLKELFVQRHDWPAAIGAYHSRTTLPNADYRTQVLARWHEPALGASTLAHPAYRDFADPTTVYHAFANRSEVYGAFARGR